MHKKKTKYIKLVRMLIFNDKKILLISALSIIIGFTFLFVFTSMSETIIKTRQDNTVKTYGKFLMVLPDISEEDEKDIKMSCSQFAYEHFGVIGNVEYADKKFVMGTMVSILMASVQGGLLDSSELRNSRDELMGNYTSVMCNTMMFFCIMVICIHIILSIYIDWEKYSYEYGVLRSFGMSYSTLQNKLFFRYSNSIIVACIFNMFLGKYAFTNGLLTKWQILISIGITVGVTYLCRIFVFYLKKKQSVSSMLNKG